MASARAQRLDGPPPLTFPAGILAGGGAGPQNEGAARRDLRVLQQRSRDQVRLGAGMSGHECAVHALCMCCAAGACQQCHLVQYKAAEGWRDPTAARPPACPPAGPLARPPTPQAAHESEHACEGAARAPKA